MDVPAPTQAASDPRALTSSIRQPVLRGSTPAAPACHPHSDLKHRRVRHRPPGRPATPYNQMQWSSLPPAGAFLKEAIRNLLARPTAQPLLLRLLKLCHAGLNYGGGQSVLSSGETQALRLVAKRRHASLPFLLFDVGASDGDYVALALELFGKQLTAYAFEPQTAAYQTLHRRFGNHARVNLFKNAIGSAPGPLDLHFGSEGDTTASFNRNAQSGQSRSESVQVTTIDKLCEDAAIERIDLLKIDTEGYELDVLRGASRMIARGRIAAIQFEFGETFLRTPYHFLDLWKLLSPQYTLHRILRHGLAPIHQYTPDLEIYKIANFLCLRKA